jgi:hypothetical protein
VRPSGRELPLLCMGMPVHNEINCQQAHQKQSSISLWKL